MSTIRSICVYCGSSPGNSPIYLEAGRSLGRAIAEAGLTLVYGGGLKGVMGAVANGAVEAGGHVTGIIPRFLIRKEAGDEAGLDHLDEVILTEDMHERKHAMFERSDAFVALPGGIGTVEEIVEIMTWAQLGRHQKPMVFGNVAGFWNPMLALIDHMKAEGFIHSQHMVRPLMVAEAGKIVPAILDAAKRTADAEGDQDIIERM
jgi:uncharacterized protein (TIGR00730 family)